MESEGSYMVKGNNKYEDMSSASYMKKGNNEVNDDESTWGKGNENDNMSNAAYY
jgi:hypothetical protein